MGGGANKRHRKLVLSRRLKLVGLLESFARVLEPFFESAMKIKNFRRQRESMRVRLDEAGRFELGRVARHSFHGSRDSGGPAGRGIVQVLAQ